MSVELEIPVRVRCEPVVVAAVEHDRCRRCRCPRSDSSFSNCSLLTKSRRTGILQILLPVQLDRTRDVAAVVCGGVFIDLDKNNVLVAGMLGDPVCVD